MRKSIVGGTKKKKSERDTARETMERKGQEIGEEKKEKDQSRLKKKPFG